MMTPFNAKVQIPFKMVQETGYWYLLTMVHHGIDVLICLNALDSRGSQSTIGASKESVLSAESGDFSDPLGELLQSV